VNCDTCPPVEVSSPVSGIVIGAFMGFSIIVGFMFSEYLYYWLRRNK